MMRELFFRSMRTFWGAATLFILSNFVIVGAFTLPFCPKCSVAKTSAMGIIGCVALLIKWHSLSVLINDYIHRLRCYVFSRLLRQNINFFTTHLPVELAPQITYDFNAFGDVLIQLISHSVFAGLLLCTFTTLLVYFTHQYLFLTFLLAPGLFFVKYRQLNRPLLELTRYLHEVFSQLRTIVALNHQSFDLLVFERWSSQISATKYKQDLRDKATHVAHFVVTAAIVASVFLLGLHFMPLYVLPQSCFLMSWFHYRVSL